MPDDPVDVADKIVDEAEIADFEIHDPLETTSIKGIRVVDVGQGDCIGILNQDDAVFCYVDYGGFVDHPEKGQSGTNPSAHRMPAKLNGTHVPVILTHWDKDHVWSAHKKNADAQACKWIVPRQYVAPTVAKLASKFKNAKRWPESIGKTAVYRQVGPNHRVSIRKCAAFDDSDENADRNLTGLAVTIVEMSGEVDEQVMLLPGDISFDKIPNWESTLPIKALVAYHHGSHAHWTAGATDQAIRNWQADSELAYSVGNNSYGHPNKANYDPDWNTNGKETGDARASGKLAVDLRWR